jgi:hypothetical protein
MLSIRTRSAAGMFPVEGCPTGMGRVPGSKFDHGGAETRRTTERTPRGPAFGRPCTEQSRGNTNDRIDVLACVFTRSLGQRRVAPRAAHFLCSGLALWNCEDDLTSARTRLRQTLGSCCLQGRRLAIIPAVSAASRGATTALVRPCVSVPPRSNLFLLSIEPARSGSAGRQPVGDGRTP